MSDGPKKQWTNRRGAQPVSDLVTKLLNPVFERRAGMTMDLIASWGEIVGEQHAAKSRPEKLVWPRQASDDDPFEPATLILACESAHALFLQHDSTAVISRVNTYFGFTAVTRMKIVQKPLVELDFEVAKEKRALPETKRERLLDMVEDIEDPKLKEALIKLGEGVFSEGSSRDN